MSPTPITIETTVSAPAEKVWRCWTEPTCIMQWNSASPDWHSPNATSDLKEGGAFSYRMEAKDGSAGFDFAGTFTKVVPNKELSFTFGDRTATVTFEEKDGVTHITESFDPESENPIEMQRQGWQSILDNFKAHAEAHG